MIHINTEDYKVTDSNFSLKNQKTYPTQNYEKEVLVDSRKKIMKEADELQNKLFAENKQSLLIIFQGIDAAGKDSSIRAIFKGLNPQGVVVSSFKKPSTLEYNHDFLWRHTLQLPERGKIRIFNRSHYENILVTKVHPEFVLNEKLPNIEKVEDIPSDFFEKRVKTINQFEEHLVDNGTKIVKFMLNISKATQKKRFIDRITDLEKNWEIFFL